MAELTLVARGEFDRVRLADVPRRVAVLPPRLDPVLDSGGKVVDAQATAVQDLDEQILRDWAAY